MAALMKKRAGYNIMYGEMEKQDRKRKRDSEKAMRDYERQRKQKSSTRTISKSSPNYRYTFSNNASRTYTTSGDKSSSTTNVSQRSSSTKDTWYGILGILVYVFIGAVVFICLINFFLGIKIVLITAAILFASFWITAIYKAIMD